MSHTRIAPAAALLLAGATLLALGPQAVLASQATAMGIPATRIDRLTVSYDDGSGQVRAYRLTCGHDEAGNAADRAADACAHLDEIGGPVSAVPSDQACSMIYGGPQTARLMGMWHGHRISEDYRRTNGCEVARWSRMVPALPVPERGVPKTADLRG